MTLKITSINYFLRSYLLICGVLLLVSASAQDLVIKLGPSTITSSGQFFISLTIPQKFAKEFNASAHSFSFFPDIDGFVKYKTEQIKNKEEHSAEIFQYYLPQKTGTIKLSPFRLKIGTAEVYSAGKTITVKKSNTPPSNLFPADLEFPEEKQDLHFHITTDKQEIYVGERFSLTAAFLVGNDNKVKYLPVELLTQATEIAKAASTDNSLMDNKSRGIIYKPVFDSTIIKNNSFRRLILYQGKYFPVNDTKIIIPPVDFHLIKYQTVRDGNIIWWKARDLILTSQQITINVKPLPIHPLMDVVPVGQFQLKESISSVKNSTGKTITYNAIITGNGDMHNILIPILKKEEQLEFYPPKILTRVINPDYEQKIFNYKILPKAPGVYRFSDYFQWVYFNPKSDKYDTLKSKLTIQVSGEKIYDTERIPPFDKSFYSIANQEKNNLRSKERDENIKYFANIVILFMLVSTAILVLKK